MISDNAISANETSSQIVYKAILDLEKSVWPETLQGWHRDQSIEPKHFEGTPNPEEERQGSSHLTEIGTFTPMLDQYHREANERTFRNEGDSGRERTHVGIALLFGRPGICKSEDR